MHIQKSLIKSFFSIILLVLSTTFVLAQTGVTGKNTTFVFYKSKDNNKAGYIVKLDKKNWAEYKVGQTEQHAHYEEVKRDSSSVYLKQADGSEIELNLYSKKIIVSEDLFYYIKTASDKATGQNATFVKYPGTGKAKAGFFVQLEGKNWTEFKTDKKEAHAVFQEIKRDAWSIFLKKSSGLIVELNLRDKKVLMGKHPVFMISGAENRPTGKNANYVVCSSGYFINNQDGTWSEFASGATQETASFDEIKRYAWTIFLGKKGDKSKKEQDKVLLHLDLNTREVIRDNKATDSISKAYTSKDKE